MALTLPFLFSDVAPGFAGDAAGEAGGEAAGDASGLADWTGLGVATGLFGTFASELQAPAKAADAATTETNISLLISF